MTVRERMLALSLLEKTQKNPEYAKQIGIKAVMKTANSNNSKSRGAKNV